MIVTETSATRAEGSPNLKISKYDITVSALATSTITAVLTLLAMIVIRFAMIMPEPDPPSPELRIVSDPYSLPFASLEAAEVTSPDDAVADPSLANEERTATELNDLADQIVLTSANASAIVAPQESIGLMIATRPNRADGTGNSAIGTGDNRSRSESQRETRWIVEFTNPGDLANYAAQLDHLGIELGGMFTAEGKLVYMHKVTAEKPTTREVFEADAGSERRLFMNWASGSEGRREADVELFRKAGIDASAATILHFYSAETEAQMAKLERDFGQHETKEIRKTYFRVRKNATAFEFYVDKQFLR